MSEDRRAPSPCIGFLLPFFSVEGLCVSGLSDFAARLVCLVSGTFVEEVDHAHLSHHARLSIIHHVHQGMSTPRLSSFTPLILHSILCSLPFPPNRPYVTSSSRVAGSDI